MALHHEDLEIPASISQKQDGGRGDRRDRLALVPGHRFVPARAIEAFRRVPAGETRLASDLPVREGGGSLTTDAADRRPPRVVATFLRVPLAASALLAAIAPGLVAEAAPPAEPGAVAEWPSYGGDPGGSRYTPLNDIGAGNLSELEVAWTYRTGDVADGKGKFEETSAFELTPLLVDGTLFACTPFNRVIALDPETGEERWSFDPGIDLTANYGNQFVCRGVATWLDPDRGAEAPCGRRIFTATNDARLFALDAASGARCADFGDAGAVDLRSPRPLRSRGISSWWDPRWPTTNGWTRPAGWCAPSTRAAARFAGPGISRRRA
jgi:hypothetical protein